MTTEQRMCFYTFPVHPKEMYDNTPNMVCDNTRLLRVNTIRMIAELSQQFNQDQLDSAIFVDIKDGEIIGFDFSRILGLPDLKCCIGDSQLALKDMTKKMWITMSVWLFDFYILFLYISI